MLEQRRVLDLHAGLATFLGRHATIAADRLEAALACAYDASVLASGDCRVQATLVLLGFREFRPAVELDPPLALLSVLALLDANGYQLEDIPYAEITARMAELTVQRPGAEAVHRWLLASTRPSAPLTAPLPPAELARLLESMDLKMQCAEGQLRVLRRSTEGAGPSWLPGPFRRQAWETVHSIPDPGEGIVGIAALRDLRLACGLEHKPFLDERAWRSGMLRLHRHLWPRLIGIWPR
jgi:hypothetical protein